MPDQNCSAFYDAAVAASISATGQAYVGRLKDQLDTIDSFTIFEDAAVTTEKLEVTEELKAEVRSALHSGEIQIEFEKADGSIRKLRGTLDLDNLISEEYHPKNEVERKKSPDVQVVFDLDKNEWRSFRWDKLVYWGV